MISLSQRHERLEQQNQAHAARSLALTRKVEQLQQQLSALKMESIRKEQTYQNKERELAFRVQHLLRDAKTLQGVIRKKNRELVHKDRRIAELQEQLKSKQRVANRLALVILMLRRAMTHLQNRALQTVSEYEVGVVTFVHIALNPSLYTVSYHLSITFNSFLDTIKLS